MIAFDANFLSLALCQNVAVAVDPVSKMKIDRVGERLNLLISDLDGRGEKILIPTPALTEFLVLVGNSGPRYLEIIHKLPRFEIRDFTERAAVEAAQAIRKALDSMSKRDDVEATWAKVNFDRQIVSIAKVEECTAIYSTDGDVARHAERINLPCFHLADLPLPPEPPEEAQLSLQYEQEEQPHIDGQTQRNKEAAIPSSTEVPGSGNRHPEGQAAAEDAQGEKDDKGENWR